jgi:hypothetical protein
MIGRGEESAARIMFEGKHDPNQWRGTTSISEEGEIVLMCRRERLGECERRDSDFEE